MNAIQYQKVSAPFQKEPIKHYLITTNKLLTAIGYITYPLLLLYTFLTIRHTCIYFLVIPASGFLLLTLIRKKINRPRPYEALDITPIIKKDTKGNSMPSRHVFSLSMIAVSWFVVSPFIGGILLLCSIAIAYIRVVGGVHYPSDVIAGILCALIWGSFYLFV